MWYTQHSLFLYTYQFKSTLQTKMFKLRRRTNGKDQSPQPELPEPTHKNLTPFRVGETNLERLEITFGQVAATILAVLTFVFLVWQAQPLFWPGCPSINDRVCNARGTCGGDGVCSCDFLFSGKACGDTQIPGYDPVSNTECSGHGYGWPFIGRPPACASSWVSSACSEFVSQKRTLLVEAGGNPLLVPGMTSLPVCVCDGTWEGLDCSGRSCPRDENGQTCGANALKTAGPFVNYTAPFYDGGCQCSESVSLREPQYFNAFSREAQGLLVTRYAALLNNELCGRIFSTNVEDVFLFYTGPEDSGCICPVNRYGDICQFNACPESMQTKRVCSGNGATGYGFRNDNRKRVPVCANGTVYGLARNECSPVATEPIPYFNADVYASLEKRCPVSAPQRCGDGRCVSLNTPQVDGCLNGFVAGTWDLARFTDLASGLACGNFSTPLQTTSCFLNGTEMVGVEARGGSLLFDPFVEIVINFTSPLVWFAYEVVSPGGGIALTNFNGEVSISPDQDPGSFVPVPWTGTFVYEREDFETWVEEEREVYLAENEVTSSIFDYWLYPITQWNYSGEVIFNESYSVVRLDREYLFRASDSRIVLVAEGSPSVSEGVIVSLPSTNTFLYSFTQTLVERATCLNNPTDCALRRVNGTHLLSPQSGLYVCYQNETVSFLEAPCDSDPLTVQSWRTELLGTLEASSFVETDKAFTLDRFVEGGRDTFPVTISASTQNLTGVPSLSSVQWITVADLTDFCACDNLVEYANRSVLNAQWVEDATREITAPLVNSLVVAKRISSSGVENVRAQVLSVDTTSRTMIVDPVRDSDGASFSVFWKNAKRITSLELNQGIDDTTLALAPFRCTDGSRTNAYSELAEVETRCNCTQEVVPEFANRNVTSCSCWDGMDAFNCTFQRGLQPFCALPASKAFTLSLQARVNNLAVDPACSCLIYENEGEPELIEGVKHGNFKYRFEYGSENYIPYKLSLLATNCSAAPNPGLSVGNPLLSTVNYTISFQIEETGDCEWDLLLDYGELVEYPITTIWMEELGVELDEAFLHFSPNGFLMQNIEQPSVVNLSNETGVAYLEYEFTRAYLPSASELTLLNAGRTYDGSDIPAQVELQASNDGSMWYLLGVYYAFGAEVTQTMELPGLNLTTFSRYRLLSRAPFTVRSWNLFTNQACTCGDVAVSISATSFLGIPTYQDWLNSIDFQLSNLNATQECVQIDNCIISFGGGSYNASNDGICNDELFVSSTFSVGVTTTYVNETDLNLATQYLSRRYSQLNESVYVVQWYNSTFYTDQELLDGFDDFFFSDIRLETQNSTYLYTNEDNVVYQPQIVSTNVFSIYNNGTNTVTFFEVVESYPGITGSGVSCATGFDASDCGPSNRLVPYMAGYGCTLNNTASEIQADVQNKTAIFTRKTYVLSNFTHFFDPYNVSYQSIPITRLVPRPVLSDCSTQTYTNPSRPYLCKNGTYAEGEEFCVTTYTDVGNGCIRQIGISAVFEAFGCACERAAGDACQFVNTVPAIPESEFTVPVSEEVACGGPPPLTERPPVINSVYTTITPAILVEMNRRVTGNSAPKSDLDVDYHRILPTFAPYGRRLKVRRVLANGEIVFTSCPFARRGPDGGYYLLTDDVASRDPLTGEPTWKIYTFRGVNYTYPWADITTYDDFGYRCPTGSCVADRSLCERSAELFPLCNGKGTCLADGTCECYAGYKTFTLSDAYTNSMAPYQDPTEWRMNNAWRHHSSSVCTAIDCGTDLNPCRIPYGCFVGTQRLEFSDKFASCPNLEGFCAPSVEDCISQINLQPELVCSGKGILAYKDFSQQPYCECGDPISSDINIANATEITQLKPNGFGGPNCDQYYPNSQTIVFSPYDYKNDQVYRSSITGEVLPGKYVGWNNNPIGADPDEFEEWDVCCDRSLYPRLELCPIVPCRVNGEVECVEATSCIDPLVYPCNNHGQPRRDGTCLCDTVEEEGVGYTHDFTEYDYLGCFKFVQCPVSPVSDSTCNYISPCGEPEKWIYPFPIEPYFENQTYSAGLGCRGLYSNETLLNGLSTTRNIYEDNLLRAATQIALDVISAEVNLAGCVCNDNDLAFNAPYLIPPSHVNITDPWIPIYLNQTYQMSLIRFFYEGFGTVNITNADGVEVCSKPLTLPNNFDEDWYEIDCGSTYACASLIAEPGYFVNCGLDPTSTECLEWKESTCTAAGNVFWPADSPSVYPGCLRSADPDGCTCCDLVLDVGSVSFDELYVTGQNTTTLDLREIRYYGFSGEVLPMTDTFRDWVDFVSQTDTTCHDERFFNQFLDADRSYYIPLDAPEFVFQSKQSKQDASAICEQTGGYLAVTDNLLNAADISTITRQCAQLSTEDDSCWVAAADRDVEDYTRDSFFLDTCGACYQGIEVSSTPATLFDSPQVVDQEVTADIVNTFRNNPNLVMQTYNNFPCTVRFSRRTTYPGGAVYVTYDLRFSTYAQVQTYGRGFFYHRDPVFPVRPRRWQRFFGCENGNIETCNIPISDPSLISWITRFIGGVVYWDQMEAVESGSWCQDIRVNMYGAGACLVPGFTSSSANFNSDVPGFFYEDYIDQRLPILRISDPTLRQDNLDTRLARQAYCMKIFASGTGYSKFQATAWNERSEDSGVDTFNLLLGYNDHDYVPAFMRLTRLEYVHPTIGGNFLRGQDILTQAEPVYWTGLPYNYFGLLTDQFEAITHPQCSDCPRVINPEMAWDDKIYREFVFLDSFTSPINPQLFLYLDNEYIALAAIPEQAPQQIGYFIHQTTYISPERPKTVEWQLDECVIADEDNYGLSVCTERVKRNYVCQYDFTKNMAQSGTDCSACGTGSRVSGQPFPGTTCFDDFPLANAEEFPAQHQIKDAYNGGYLNVYVQSYDLGDPSISFENTSIIMAYEQAWELWTQGVSTRQKTLSENQQPSTNWKDMSLTENFPFDCETGYCAISSEFCDNPLSDVSTRMADRDIPICYGPVPEDQAFIDTSCGVNIPLRDYVTITKDGPPQDLEGLRVLSSSVEGVELQTLGGANITYFFNALKNPTKFIFNINVTNTIYLTYRVNCVECVDPVYLRVFIHTLTFTGVDFETIYSDPILLDVTGVTSSITVSFTVPETGQDTITPSGQVLPRYIYQGVGFEFDSLAASSAIELTNPIVTNPTSRAACTNRTLPVFMEPKPRIRSSAPKNKCVISDDDLDEFPDLSIGTCACDPSLGGDSCSYTTVDGKVCGGFGIVGGTLVEDPDSDVVTLVTSDEDGAFLANGIFYCKGLNLGVSIYSTLVTNTISQFPEVFVESVPINSERKQFFKVDNPDDDYYERSDLSLECDLETAELPFFINDDEVKRAMRELGVPVYWNMNQDFEDIDDSNLYLTSTPNPTSLGADVDCSVYEPLCAAANFNNYVYGTTADALTDGDVSTSIVLGSPFTLTIDPSADLLTRAYVWGGTVTSTDIDCKDAGACADLPGEATANYRVWECRCPTYQMEIVAGTFDEVQVFDYVDATRASIYVYS